ncbi:hypothetical protein KIH74_32595 [Kineosporia sp. J2-2]|uniref:beta-mannosidase n=1 Tax=Kineosporia corallincola TaxID=2835133 RepID=A0ABS5TSF5_9ACTN|nr:glycoside hydrolase family 2 TIM barrel-domain containing protein [Kineosporia corallincola]MBT0773730.1 hypothetical protein [Kineosporia corallincola]
MIVERLDRGWTLRGISGVPDSVPGARENIPANVPGNVHADLLEAGLIPDPYVGEHEAALSWMHRAAWEYTLDLRAPAAEPGERADLVFAGLDTVATITLGGHELGTTRNMHRSYRFDAGSRLSAAGAPLSVRFDPALAHAERQSARLGRRPHANIHPYNAIRKAAFGFGWDWGPDLQGAGLWRPVTLQRWRVARLASVRPLVTVDDDGTGRVEVHVEVERGDATGDLDLQLTLRDLGGSTVRVTGTCATVVHTVPDPPLWWPAGHGQQPLIGLTVALFHGDEQLDVYRRDVGFRSVRLDQPYDQPYDHPAESAGRALNLVVNGRPVYVKGVNWIPEDALLTGVSAGDYSAAVGRAVAANANLLRVWGGGIYEDRAFYQACDEQGVLVWQDFALACAAYAEKPPLREEILAEARENITRLSPHPSLVLWNGGNENLWGHEDWGWRRKLLGRSWGAGYYHSDFPKLLAELDPTRPYLPGSPSSPGYGASEVHPNDEHHGVRHEWEVWNRLDYTAHGEHVPRFCAEFGWQAPPTWSTLVAAVGHDSLAKDAPAFLSHQKAAHGTARIDAGLEHHFGVPTRFADWHWAAQLNQARATAFAVEHFRAHAPRTSGCVLWQLNDCWPVTSWSMVDGENRLKPAWYALRRAYAPRLLGFRTSTFDGTGTGLRVAVINDDEQPFAGVLTLRRATFGGAVQAGGSLPFDVPARGVQLLDVPAVLAAPGDPHAEVLVAEAGTLRAIHCFAIDRDLAYEPRPFQATARHLHDDLFAVTVTATSFARDVTVLADRADPDAVADEALVSLLAGESHTFRVQAPHRPDPAALTHPLVLRCANDVIGPA